MLKIASWNVNSLNVRLPHVCAWTEVARPDVLALQETKLTDDRFPVDALQEAGYQSVFAGQKTYNGVAILSRQPATDPVTDIPGLDDHQRRILAATVGDLRVVNLYVVNGSEVGSEKYDYKLHWLDCVTRWLATELEQHEHLVVLGDFNIAPDDRDVYTGRQGVQLVGLPDEHVSPQTRSPHRPGAGLCGDGRALHGQLYRRRAAPPGTAIRPRARHCGIRTLAAGPPVIPG
jgi:exodeoxyribonuclease III